MFCYDRYTCYAVGRKAICYGPEGNMLWAGRHYVMGRKALYVVGRKALLCGPEGHGLERRMCAFSMLIDS